MVEFDPRAIFDALDRHGVRYVLIGGMAAILHGASHVTTDVDVVPQDARENLERLSEVLKELHARIRVAGAADRDELSHRLRPVAPLAEHGAVCRRLRTAPR